MIEVRSVVGPRQITILLLGLGMTLIGLLGFVGLL